jgi:hypothetical protein
VIVAAATLAACGGDVERGPAEARNLAALDTIPTPAGAVVVRTETHGDKAPDTDEGPIVGWSTVRELRLTGELQARRVIARGRRDLERAGWRMSGFVDDFYLNARRRDACLHFLTSAAAPSQSDEIPEFTATDEAPPEDQVDPGDVVAHGLVLKVSGC